MLKLMNFLEVAPTPKEAIINAWTSNFKDLEDAFQHYSALLIPGL